MLKGQKEWEYPNSATTGYAYVKHLYTWEYLDGWLNIFHLNLDILASSNVTPKLAWRNQGLSFLENEAECVYVVDENVSVALNLPARIC